MKRSSPSGLARNLHNVTLIGLCLTGLAACSDISRIDTPYYSISDVQNFLVYGAPSQLMRLETHDSNDLIDPAILGASLSEKGFPPRITFLAPDAPVPDGKTLRDGYRVVAVVNPALATNREKMCTAPQSAPLDPAVKSVPVRYGFCAGDKIISEIRANYPRADLNNQIRQSSGTIIQLLFSRRSKSRTTTSASS